MAEGYKFFFTNILDYALVIQLLVVSVSVVAVLSPVKRQLKSVFLALVRVAILFAIDVVFISFLFALSGIVRGFLVGNCFLLGYIASIMLYAVFFCRYTPKVRVIMASALFAIIITVIEFAGLLGQLLERGLTDIAPMDWMGFAKTTFLLMLVCFVIIQIRFTMKRYHDAPVSGMVLIVTASLVTAAMSFIFEGLFRVREMSDKYLIFTCIMFAALYIINIVSYMMIYFVCRERNRVIALKSEKQFAEANAEMMQLSEKNLGYLRQLKHDIKNQYTYINMLIGNGQYEEVKKYFKALGDDIVMPLSYIDSGNKNVDAILNMEMSKANAYDVNIDIKVVVPPRLPFSDSALCSIISNLVDNAIEAAMRYEMKNEGVVVRIYPRQDYLYICVENSLPPDADAKDMLTLVTSKSDSTEHGFGTRIVKRIVQQYNGYVTFTVENNRFVAEAMLDFINTEK